MLERAWHICRTVTIRLTHHLGEQIRQRHNGLDRAANIKMLVICAHVAKTLFVSKCCEEGCKAAATDWRASRKRVPDPAIRWQHHGGSPWCGTRRCNPPTIEAVMGLCLDSRACPSMSPRSVRFVDDPCAIYTSTSMHRACPAACCHDATTVAQAGG